ncbi:response regulator transcription factor [Paenibacillus roseipurpureus]|uniref:Response regulator n=1 Tax=Paenibacillus roseopurpureus TaxID=2918901 RepID=A0AA96LQQ8_9BACL|nr:response regulator [Paenibacillus sp. MBLB1832]WNR44846.1 response regulator [Paenibacillus sp. MBLB1832]
MMTILLVEDEEVIRKGLVNLIGQVSSDFTVVYEAAHGREALDYLARNVPDVLITDIRMREMDGLELIAKVREQHADMQIIIISGYGDFAYAQKALRLGVSDYLLKPIDRMMLVTALDKIHGKHSKNKPEHAELDSEEGKEGKEGEGRRAIRKVKEYIQSHPEGDLRLQVLADHIHLNPAYLSQLFKQDTGLNLSDYITEMRMARAKLLLATTDLKIYDVARLSGYQSPKHFMLVFKSQVGTTPGAYREECGQ